MVLQQTYQLCKQAKHIILLLVPDLPTLPGVSLEHVVGYTARLGRTALDHWRAAYRILLQLILLVHFTVSW